MSCSMLSSMKAWILKHNALMPIYIAAAFAIIAMIIVLLLIYKTLCKNPVCDINSHNNISLMTRLEEMSQGLIEFSLEEIKRTTNNFGESNLIRYGSFGPVYIGLLRDTIVAIKSLTDFLHPRFLAEVNYLSKIRHSNVVNLLGYCCENGQQMIVYEYLVNGNMRDYLQDSVDISLKKRISIALGAAKGLQHLHSLTPPLTQYNRFKTAKVLLDADFNAKVSDAGLSRLVEMRNEEANDHDLEVGLHDQETFDETSYMYSFGLFLLELITGEEPQALTSNDELIQWLGPRICSDTFVDQRMSETYSGESLNSVVKIMLKCLNFPANKRPKMEEVVTELEEVYKNDFTSEEGSTKITLGSELFSI